jgi:hypothetical protein
VKYTLGDQYNVCKNNRTLLKRGKRVAIELGRVKVPFKTIRDKVKMSNFTLRRILAFGKKN